MGAFYQGVRQYYVAACKYMIKKFPFNDEVLLHAEIADISKRQSKAFDSVLFFTLRFPCLLPPNPNMDTLEEEFLNYQVEEFSQEIATQRVDKAWHWISQQRDANGALKFSMLSKVMCGILLIFHSNSDCERIFSFVTKNKTEGSSKTLSALVCRKTYMCSHNEVCHKQNPSKDLLRKAKQATREKLNR